MTLQEALDIVDEMKPNMMSKMLKYKYLTEIEQLIFAEIILKHEIPGVQRSGRRPVEDPMYDGYVWVMDNENPPEAEQAIEKPLYTEDSDPGTVLIVPDPYSMVYIYWLMSKIDIQNQEDGRYNVDRAHFENAYETMSDWYTRNHMPIQTVREFRL